jgi:hypothetical protein
MSNTVEEFGHVRKRATGRKKESVNRSEDGLRRLVPLEIWNLSLYNIVKDNFLLASLQLSKFV